MTRRRRSGIVHDAITSAMQLRAECRAEFDLFRDAEYMAAEEACRGRMLNRRGMEAGIEPLSLFMGNQARAYAYASEELVAFWRDERPRVTYEVFERQWLAGRQREDAWGELVGEGRS